MRQQTIYNGNVTKYVYSATGEKLRVTHQTAVPNISVPIGSTRELAYYEIQYTDSTDYLLGGSLTLKNGRIDKYQFGEGYCQAERYIYNTSQDDFTFCYYDRDHLGNVRQVTEADGSREGNIIQKVNYYPFGAEFCDGTANNSVQPYKYNGKELDRMHGLDWYDYGARHYDAAIGSWPTMDPLAEKYYNLSPYNYCGGNPVNAIDEKGDSIFVLIAPNMASGFGHMALLIQNKKGDWNYYSKNGTSGWFGLYGEPSADNKGEVSFPSISDFLNDPTYNPIDKETSERKYAEGFLIPATPEEDIKAKDGALAELNKKYNVLGSNCAATVQSALHAAGKRDGFPTYATPSTFQDGAGSFIDLLIRAKTPNIIYDNIKKQNKGEVIKSYH